MKEDADGAMAADEARDEHFKWHWVRMALKSPNTIICSLAWFFLLIPIYVHVLLRSSTEHFTDNFARAMRFFCRPSFMNLAIPRFTPSYLPVGCLRLLCSTNLRRHDSSAKHLRLRRHPGPLSLV